MLGVYAQAGGELMSSTFLIEGSNRQVCCQKRTMDRKRRKTKHECSCMNMLLNDRGFPTHARDKIPQCNPTVQRICLKPRERMQNTHSVRPLLKAQIGFCASRVFSGMCFYSEGVRRCSLGCARSGVAARREELMGWLAICVV